ncbi:MAG: ATP-binding protein [Polyangiaceae bacterium]|nr:ATP-binding protein [Polyangiaceae bacterium]
MSKKKPKVMSIDTIDRQRKYVDAQKEKGHGLGVVFADAFLRGMRDLGYKNPAWALAEQLDNAFQAGADSVAIRYAFDASNKSRVKPDMIALCDNGNGMIPDMIGYAVRWGGTDREGDRNGFGRYGYGLPSSAVSLAKRYTVYSKANGGEWHAVTVDIDELAAAAGDIKKTEALLTARPSKLPPWVAKAAKGDDTLDLGTLKSGTVIVFEDLDRLKRLSGWIKAETLRTKLLQHFGVIYRHWVPERRVVVDGVAAQAVDPLFLMEHGRFFDETSIRAKRVEARTFEVETPRGTTGTVTIRAAVLPPNFQLVDPAQYGIKGAKTNRRWDVMKDYNGLLICRERRQIDCIPPRWTKFQNYDANVKVEIDFDPELDEYFGITTAKQQIVLDDEMWEKLQHKGKAGGALVDLVEDLRREFEKVQKDLKAKSENRGAKDGPRPSAVAMEQSEQFKGTVPEPTPAQQDEAKRNLDDLAAERADATGQPKEKVIEDLIEETSARRWEVEFTAIPEGPFYRPIRLGEQKRLVVNTDHPFYTRIYDAAPEVRAALEVVLFVLAERELEVKKDAETFYRAERQRWSERLRHALDTLVPEETMVNKAAVVAERMHMAVEEDPPAE